jgi:hypothetical protein
MPPRDEHSIQAISLAVAELESQKRLTDAEITNIKIRLESYISTTQEQFRTLGATVTEIRDMARDNKHITIGVDGNNGLKGTLEILVRDVTAMIKEFEFLRQTAHSYVEMKTWLIRLLITSVAAIIFQFGSAFWTMNMQTTRQDSLREEMTKVTAYINKQQQLQEDFKTKPQGKP